jgi:hypothetical protein
VPRADGAAAPCAWRQRRATHSTWPLGHLGHRLQLGAPPIGCGQRTGPRLLHLAPWTHDRPRRRRGSHTVRLIRVAGHAGDEALTLCASSTWPATPATTATTTPATRFAHTWRHLAAWKHAFGGRAALGNAAFLCTRNAMDAVVPRWGPTQSAAHVPRSSRLQPGRPLHATPIRARRAARGCLSSAPPCSAARVTPLCRDSPRRRHAPRPATTRACTGYDAVPCPAADIGPRVHILSLARCRSLLSLEGRSVPAMVPLAPATPCALHAP